MLFDSSGFMFLFLLAYACFGALVGVLTGWLVSLLARCGYKGLLKDALLGAGGFIGGCIGIGLIPWPPNMVDGWVMNTYQSPERIGLVVAIGLPLLYEVHRLERKRRLPRVPSSRNPDTQSATDGDAGFSG